MAATLVSSGMAAAGYTSLNIDDCWEAEARTADGQLTYNATKFPSGLKAFGDYVHSLNLSFGLYTSSGPYTCQQYPGQCRRRTTPTPRSTAASTCRLVLSRCCRAVGGLLAQAAGSTRRTTRNSLLHGAWTT